MDKSSPEINSRVLSLKQLFLHFTFVYLGRIVTLLNINSAF